LLQSRGAADITIVQPSAAAGPHSQRELVIPIAQRSFPRAADTCGADIQSSG
jgi:hypothetical protein